MSCKIAMLFPYAPAYRELIYQLMDKKLDIDWYFCGNATRDLKMFDYSLLENVDLSMEEKQIFGAFTRYKGLDKLHLEKYDVLIIAGVYQNLSEWKIAIKYGRFRRRPALYFWTHGMYGKESFLRRVIKKFFYRCGQGVFLYGNYAKEIMLREGFDINKLHVIHNSLDYSKQYELRNAVQPTNIYREHFGNNNPVLLFLGRLTPVKQLDMILAAVASLKERGEKYNVMFVGDGPEKDKLVSLSIKFGINDNVWFYGACYDEKVNAELVYNADLCVAPGNIGLTAMHVLMFGCPAITHSCFKWQMPEFESITPYKTGLFFEYRNQKSLEDKISEWFKVNMDCREQVRMNCYNEIDTQWTPEFQLKVLKQALKID